MKRYLLIFAMLLGAVCSWGRDAGIGQAVSSSTPEISASQAPDLVKWTLLDSTGNAKVYRAYIMCSGQLRVAIKVENTSASKVRVSWNSAFAVSGNPVDITLPFTFDMEAKVTLTGDCQQATLLLDPYLYVTSVKEGECDYIIRNLNTVIL